jgi:hypothetical protein
MAVGATGVSTLTPFVELVTGTSFCGPGGGTILLGSMGKKGVFPSKDLRWNSEDTQPKLLVNLRPIETGVYSSFPAELMIIDTPTKAPMGLGGISNEGHILKQLL